MTPACPTHREGTRVYSEHDRPSTKRILITVGILVVLIGVAIGLTAVGTDLLTTRFSNQPAEQTAAAPSRTQSPATATVSVPQAEPAPASQAATAAATQPQAAPAAASPTVPSPAPAASGLGVVVIDAGHQGRQDSGLEPIGPGSSTKRPKVESGTEGVVTHAPESLVNLEVAKALQRTLEARGVTVVMVRTSQNVDIPNSKRAQIANDAHAALFIRLHCDGVDDHSVHGVLTLRPAADQWTGPIVAPSEKAAKLVHAATLAATGAANRGIQARSDLSGFNWSKVPAVLVEMGVMSNPTEDRKLSTTSYQQKLADGMANGIVAYLKTR